jgi:hypothetical protein
MEPIAIVTALVAALYIFGRGPLVVAPTATVAFYRRMIATPKRIRITGVLFILLAAALIVTARQARAAQGDITFLVEGLGWATVAAAVWLITAPGPFQRLTNGFWDAVSTPGVQRAIGVFNVAIGLGLGWVAFFVL